MVGTGPGHPGGCLLCGCNSNDRHKKDHSKELADTIEQIFEEKKISLTGKDIEYNNIGEIIQEAKHRLDQKRYEMSNYRMRANYIIP